MTHVRGHCNLLEHTEVEREVAAVLVVERHLVTRFIILYYLYLYHLYKYTGGRRDFPAGAPFPEAVCARHATNAIRNLTRNNRPR